MREIVKYILLLMVGIMPVSCVFDADRCIVPLDEPRSIQFTISVEGGHTRAAWEDSYTSEEGVPFDYRILPDQMRLVVLTTDGTRIGEVRDLDYWSINDAHTEFQFIGQLPREVVERLNLTGSEQNYKFMVLANCGDNLNGEQYITYSHTQLNPANEASAIPMWGVTTADVSALYTQDNLDLGDIWLLRAAAKVEVKLSDALKAKDTEITAATLKYYNQTGYALPSGWSTVSETKKIDQEECLRLYRHAAVNLPFIKDEATGNYYVYVTEYDNINYSGERNKISLTFNIGGVEKTFEDAISFCNYSDGAPVEGSHYNIVRNHIYEFEILSIAGSSLVLEYTVADWTTEDWDGNGKEYEEHDLSYPTYHNPVVPYEFLTKDATEQADYVISQEPTMQYNAGNHEQGGFHCYFQIVEPEGVQWEPVFMGTKENYRIKVYEVDKNLKQGNEAIFDSAESGKQGNLGACRPEECVWYHIVVFPLSEDGAGTIDVEFGITYYQGWTDQYINLYVNGEYDNIRWPNSGTNPKLIKIKHVAAQ